MKSSLGKSLAVILFILFAVFWLSGCGAKGYIVASVQSVIGLDVSENPKTQVPHVRFGFVRSQYYYIPTGKSESGKNVPGGSGEADETPELVSEINVDLKFLSNAKIHERFAVGKRAVSTAAAQHLFAPAVEASKRFPPIVSKTEPEIKELRDKISKICQEDKSKKDLAESWIKSNYPEFQQEPHPLTRFLLHPPSQEALESLLQELEKT